jgi:hypothetical protein
MGNEASQPLQTQYDHVWKCIDVMSYGTDCVPLRETCRTNEGGRMCA